MGALLLSILVATAAGCSAGAASENAPRAGVEVVDPSGGAETPAVTAEQEEADEPSDTCHGVLSCTFFGLGAALALPFWVLGAVLGLVF
jgi:hypothetical protein